MEAPERIAAQFTRGSKPMALAIYMESGMTADELKDELFKWDDESVAFDILVYFMGQMQPFYAQHINKFTRDVR